MTSPERHRMNLLPVGFIYFGLFSIAVWVDAGKRMFQFPRVDDVFVSRLALDVLVGIISGLIVSFVTIAATRFFTVLKRVTDQFHAFVGPLCRTEVFFISAFSAMGEEFFFRGIIQAKLGIVVASLMFGFLHVGPNRSFLPWTIFAIVVGFLLGGIYVWCGDLLAPVSMHFVINYVNLSVLVSLEKHAVD